LYKIRQDLDNSHKKRGREEGRRGIELRKLRRGKMKKAGVLKGREMLL
jgi:hypothetical protein